MAETAQGPHRQRIDRLRARLVPERIRRLTFPSLMTDTDTPSARWHSKLIVNSRYAWLPSTACAASKIEAASDLRDLPWSQTPARTISAAGWRHRRAARRATRQMSSDDAPRAACSRRPNGWTAACRSVASCLNLDTGETASTSRHELDFRPTDNMTLTLRAPAADAAQSRLTRADRGLREPRGSG